MTEKVFKINGKEIPKEIFEIIMKRIEAMPPGIKLAVLGTTLTREDIIKEICKGSEIGKEIFGIELSYYKDLTREYEDA